MPRCATSGSRVKNLAEKIEALIFISPRIVMHLLIIRDSDAEISAALRAHNSTPAPR